MEYPLHRPRNLQHSIVQDTLPYIAEITDLPPPLCLVPGLSTANEKVVEKCGEGLRVEESKGPEDKFALLGREGNISGADLHAGD